MPITALPTPPSRQDPANFATRADAFLGALPTFATEANSTAADINASQSAATASAVAAAASQTAAAASAAAASASAATAASASGATVWVSGTTYALGAVVYSNVTGRTYRRIIAGAGTTDPSADTTNWRVLALDMDTGYPTIRPSLNLDFANTKVLDPRITFARASEGRFYDGKTFAKAEENLLQRSQELDNGVWVRIGATISANTQVAPDGTATADTITATAATSTHQISSPAFTLPAATHTASVFAKAGTHSFIQVRFGAAFGSSYANFDLTGGTVGTAFGGTGAIVSIGNGWYRCSITAATLAGSSNVIFYLVSSASAGNAESWTATGTETAHFWGAQLEQRSSVTAYTPTTTAPITNYIPALQTAASGVARFDHNPATGESLGLLIEEQRTNLVLQSEDFSTTWTNVNSVEQTNIVAAPDGTLTADMLQADGVTTASPREFWQNVNGTVTAAHTFSVYAKARNGNFLGVSFRNQAAAANFCSAEFNLSTGAISVAAINGGNATGATASIASVGNGWYRCSVSGIADTSGTQFTVLLTGRTTSNNNSVAANTELCYLWGAQLEAGAFPTSYIPTGAAQATRQADAASMTGTNFSSWYRQDEGTFSLDAVMPPGQLGFFRYFYSLYGDSLSANDALGLSVPSNTLQARWAGTAGGVSQFSFSTTLTATQSFKAAVVYKSNDAAVSFDGASALTDTSVTLPSGINRFQIGSFNTSSNTCHIRRLAYYPARLTNTQLQAITA